MGYFSELLAEMSCGEDCSYPSPRRQLSLRIEELDNRLAELAGSGGIFEDRRLSPQEIDCALPEHLFRAEDVCRAKAFAEEALLLMESEEEGEETEFPGQIRFDLGQLMPAETPKWAA